jgi:diadenosine tetraphosphate (Ap4A) HIT family hydrolase
VTLERLWAGWRAAYIEDVTSGPLAGADGCLLCRLQREEPATALIVAGDDLTFVVMNAYPYTAGHVMVAPRRHEGELDGLTSDEAAALMAMTQRATSALKAAYRPDGMNVGLNLGRAAGAGVPGHLHMHALPRWGGDTNFLTSVAEARVLPEPLTTSWEKLRAAWPGGTG